MSEKLYNELAKYYDSFNFSDYKKQAEFVVNIIKEYMPDDRNVKILDLACGTGEHIKILKKNFQISGLDLNEGMIKVAKEKNPNIDIVRGDLNNLHITKNKYNIIYCFSSSIQYVLDPNNLVNVFKSIRQGLKDKGVFILDLAYCQEKWQEGYVGIKTVVKDNFQIAEIFKSKSVDNISYYNPIYLINENGENKFYIDDHKIYLYSINYVRSILKNSGFSRISINDNYSSKNFILKTGGLPVFVTIK